jgi:ribosomal protein S18 acetylase RimI-like enzyme
MDTYRRVAKRKGLDWALAHETEDTGLRPAEPGDVTAIAELHRRGIHTGFLAALGRGFLEELYLVMLADPRSTVIVAELDDAVVGFIAGTAHTGALYKRFLRTRSLRAAARAGWRLMRPTVLRKGYETFRYGKSEHERTEVAAELLAMAVAPRLRGRGVGKELVTALLGWAGEESLQSMRVVVGAGNEAAITLYQRCGFGDPRPREVHAGSPSWELVWKR